jgi:hypothetical protein
MTMEMTWRRKEEEEGEKAGEEEVKVELKKER